MKRSVQRQFGFTARVVYWRGPAPFVYAAIPPDVGAEIQAISSEVSYGWGCIPVLAEIGGQDFRTALFPKDGSNLLPLKAAVRKALPPFDIGDSLAVNMTIEEPGSGL
jgi:Domain of unknown function (DUF1905).